MNSEHPKGEHAQGFGPIRRKERAISERAEIDRILQSTNVMHLGLADNQQPLVLPLFYWYNGTSIYFHSAHEGTKMGILARNPQVCFTVSVDHGFIEDDAACDFEAKHRTVVGFGRASQVTDESEKIAALDGIVAGFTQRKFEYPKARLAATAVMRIDIASITGKKHGV